MRLIENSGPSSRSVHLTGARWTLTLSALMVGGVVVAQDDSPWASKAKTTFTPTIHHPNIASVTLFAENPDIVTPIGIAVAPDGRVFVQENHTHKRNRSYKGPKTDRILVFEDTDQDGVADDKSIFYEGHTFSTDLLFSSDGHLYVSTRWFVGRFLDAATKSNADGEPEKLVVCETAGNYPHNGVGGLAIDPANPEWLAFGFGENLGADYTFIGSDGVRLSGGAEGGSTYQCRADGSGLVRRSTGHWNAFGMAYGLDGSLFSTDNDPNATPPNRLLHIIPGADFGFEYRYGRSGRHPLVCWYGENPGTLGMIGALGEAASGLISHGPGQLLSASWTDNRVDLHALTPAGDSFSATREPFLTGPDDFRPVHFAYSADGKSLYFTDWVKLSYPVHGHGRIWRVDFKEPIQMEPLPRDVISKELSTEEALAALGSDDPYRRTRAIDLLANDPDFLAETNWRALSNPIARSHFAVALKRSNPTGHTGIIPDLLNDEDPAVRFVGIKWIADEKLQKYRSDLEALLNRPDLGQRDLRALVAALARISGESRQEFSPDATLLEVAMDVNKPAGVRAMALQSVSVEHRGLTVDILSTLVKSDDAAIQSEAIRSLTLHADDARTSVLAEVAADDSLDAPLRADAIAGLASVAAEHVDMLRMLSDHPDASVAQEARRTLVAGGIVNRDVGAKPPVTEIQEWMAFVDDESTGQADPAVGRRLFFHSKFAGCYKCHAMDGRGQQVGPDLTTIRNQSGITREWLLEHMVNPNAEMAPYYRPQQLLTVEGKVLTGLILGKEGKLQAYVGTDGVVFYVDKEDVEERQEMTTSIMPTGLLDSLSANEIRDLISYLLDDRESS
ncbi:MAG: PVC-type heme-binding CxxCH protein [Planctomycetota bacterium]